ncbi:MAG: MBOAT family protein [Sandaracinaceae bacterium]|nr:MBOAT family protein [Sandaracinaceae bacterium]
MLFNSLDYFVFLALAVAGFWALARHRVARLAFIVVASCLFYMAANPKYILLVLLSTVVDYVIGLRLGDTEDERKRRVLLVCSLVFNLGILAVFKYFDFWSSATASMASLLFGVEFSPFLLRWALPVGISFYTFQTMSYSIDVYRRTLEPKRSLLEFTAFVMFFPQLVAGPIVRASEFLPQLDGEPTLRREQVSRGLFLIGTGLVKKVAVADYLSANLVDRVFAQPELYTGTEVVIALYAFTMQIYCDFSGYTDMARGSALLMGFEIPENFDRPYQATNPAEFWRRWHMTLSRWLRDYLYFPLGGSRGGPVRAYFNLWLTMMLIGMWHGAAWTFVLYGFLQATVMVIHRFVVRHTGGDGEGQGRGDALAMRALKVFWALQFVVFSRILFRASSMDNARAVVERIFSGSTSTAQISLALWAMLLVTFALHFTPQAWFRSVERAFLQLPAPVQGLALGAVGAILSQVATGEAAPYIYFQF